MGFINPRQVKLAPFFYGCLLGVFLVYGTFFADHSGLLTGLIERVYAVVNNIEPNADGTVAGTPTGCAVHANCLADGVTQPTTPNTADFVVLGNNTSDYYQMATLPSVDTVSQIVVQTYHQEGNANMATYVSLWDATEATQYGTEVQLTNRGTAQWDPATFSGLALSQAQLDGLRVRLRCTRPGGGKSDSCTEYAMYAEVTYTETIDVVVSTTGTQSNVAVGASDAYIGGSFVISEDTSSRNITSITIQEQGTVDALNDLDNIKLFYELAADCSVASYGGSETQFGLTDTSGFSGANGTSVFTDSVAVTTASDMCVYVVLDVLGTAMGGETIEVQITDPTTDVVGSASPIITPATAVALGGTTNLTQINLTQQHYHWRNDDGSEAGATSATGNTEDTVFNDFPRQTTYRLRFGVANEGNSTSAATQYLLEYATKAGSCGPGLTWVNVGEAGGDWDMSLSPNIADGNTTDVALAANGAVTDGGTVFVGTGALRETTATSAAITLTSTQWTELEYSIEANASAGDGATYCFRVTDAGTPIDTYTVYPEASIASDILVTGSGSQSATVNTDTTNQYLGGSFDITDSSAGAHTISDFTIHASGTVDLQTNIDNIKLFYDLDTTAPQNCVGETYAGTELQFGATDTDGFSGTGTSTFSGTLSVSPTQAVCFYVVYDVTAGASDGETFEVYLNDASADLVIGSGSIAPAAAVDIGDFTTFVDDFVEQVNYHWRENDGTEAGATSAVGGTENTAFVDFPTLTTKRIRFGVHNSGGASTGNFQYQLEWGQRISTCEAISTWVDVDTGGDEWSVVASQLVDNADTTNVSVINGGVTNTGTFKAVNGGQQDVDAQTGNIDLLADDFVALEYSVQASAAATEGTPYCFRVTNAGTPIDNYVTYPEATIKLATDFAVYRGVSTVTGATLTLTEGVDYDLQFNDASRAFIRITNAHNTGGGPAAGSTGNNNASDVTAYFSNPGNITTSVNIARGSAVNDTRVAWEVIEYIGELGGENEIVVRSAAAATYGTAATALTTGTIPGVVTDADMVPFITGQFNPDGGRQDYESTQSTAVWNAGADTITFTRGHSGADAVGISYAAVEFVGANWNIQRAEHTYSGATGVIQTQPITLVNSLTRAFVHAQHRTGTGEDQHGDFGHEVWLNSVGSVAFRLDGAAQTAALHTSVAWVIENTQTTGDRMVVSESNGTIAAGGGGLTSTNINIKSGGAAVDDLSVTSLFVTTRNNGTGRTFPEPMVSASIISDTQYNLQVSDDGDANTYRAAVVEWPTASRKLQQNDFRLYENNDALTPTVGWATLGENEEMTALDEPIASGESIRIRMSLRVTAAAMPIGVDSFELQYGERDGTIVTTCSGITDWRFIGDNASTTALWRGVNATPVDGTTLPSGLLSETTVLATYEESNPTALTPNLALVNDVVEFDWNIEHNGAVQKTDYCFRMVEADDTPFIGYDTYPVIRTVGYGPVIGNWRFFDDELNETPVTGLGTGENNAPSGVDDGDVIKLRATLAEKSGADGVNTKFKVQYSQFPSFSVVNDVEDIATCTATSTWCYADGAGVDNAQITTSVISDADSCVAGVGFGCGTHNESTSTAGATFDHTRLTNAEFEFTLQNAGARVNAVYYFRLWDVVNDEVVLASSTYPSLLAASSSATFASETVTVGETIDTHVIDIAGTASGIAFGSIPFSTEFEAAQRFTIDTNATEGYSVLVFSDQDLTDGYGNTIPPVTAPNASPAGWGTVCTTLSTGCFGYHTTDGTLAGGSSRFGPPDSFAALTTSPAEIFYSSVPGSAVHDIVYKLFVGQEQPAGTYQASMTYLLIPVF